MIVLLGLAGESAGLGTGVDHRAGVTGGEAPAADQVGDVNPAPVAPVSPLISVEELAREIGDPNLVLLHVGDKPGYDVAHISGARFITLDDISRPRGETLRLELPDAATLVSAFEGLGISNGSRVVLYFGRDWATPTARVFFTLDFLGLGDRVSYLDGGMPAWQAAGHPTTSEVPQISRGKIAPHVKAGLLADMAAVGRAGSAPSTSIVDARDHDFYTGENDARGRYARPGHIPGAKSVPFGTLLQEDGRFRPREQLEAQFTEAGIAKDDVVISYCHIGQQASLVYFVARLLGHDARLYDGSFEEWSAHPDAPVETGMPSTGKVVPR